MNTSLLLATLSLFSATALAKPESVPTSLLQAPDSLEVTIWAQSPQLRNPTNMDIDAAGRIWVTEGVNYRHNSNRDPDGDRVLVIEDTNGDGQADQSHVFVQEPDLIAPLGIAVIDNKIYVSNAPDLIVYTDVDRNLRFDPRIDKREVLLTGFNGRNHDHALHSVTFGPDGRLYLNHGNAGALVTDRSGRTFRVGSSYDGTFKGENPIYGYEPIEYSGAKSDDGHVYVGGFAFSIKPDGTDLQVVGHNFRNSYEQTITSFGDVFQNDNDDPPACRTTYLMEYGNASFFSRDGTRSWRADRRPGQSIPEAQWRQHDPHTIPSGDVYGAGAPTGIVYYEGDLFGDEWRGMLLSCEAARNVIFGYLPENQDAGFTLDRFDFLTSNPEGELAGTDAVRGKVSNDLKTYFRPSDVSIGPDGAIYVADWFDPRVGGHREYDEKSTGAIYRIAPKDFQPQIPELDLSTVSGQIEALKSPAVNVRALGYTSLIKSGVKAIQPLLELLDHPNPYIAARPIWILPQLGEKGIQETLQLLKHEDAPVRSTAYQALRNSNIDILPHAKRLARDPSPIVRREVSLSLRDIPFEDSGPILATLAEGYDGTDPYYLAAWGIGATGKEEQIYTLIKDEKTDPTQWSDAYAKLIWKLTPTAAVESLAERAQSTELTEAQRLESLTALGFIPHQSSVDTLLELATSDELPFSRHALWWLLNYRQIRWPNMGVDERLKATGLYDPEKAVLFPSVIPEAEPPSQETIADAISLRGSAERGSQKIAACYACHRVGDMGTEFGPDLTRFGSQQTKEVIIEAIMNPNADIAHGYDGYQITLNDGQIIHGFVDAFGDPVLIRSMGGIEQFVPRDRIQKMNRTWRSLMLSSTQLGLSHQDVADITAYLQSL